MHSKVRVRDMSLTAVYRGQQARTTQGKTAEQYENIKVLRELRRLSIRYARCRATGVDCEYCHLQKDRVSDELVSATARQIVG